MTYKFKAGDVIRVVNEQYAEEWAIKQFLGKLATLISDPIDVYGDGEFVAKMNMHDFQELNYNLWNVPVECMELVFAAK